jgi:serpin B
MCQAGAKNKTSDELKDLLGLSELSDQEILQLNSKHLDTVNSKLGGDVTLKSANKLYPNVGFQLKSEFNENLSRYFHTEAQQVNFTNNSEAAHTINEWVAHETNDKIKDLIPADSLNSMTRLVLVNAIYFKGNWLQKFDQALTSKQDFHLANGSIKQVDTMKLSGKKFHYLWHPGGLEANALELPYVGDKVAMTILLPESETNLAEIQSNLSGDIFDSILKMSSTGSSSPQEINLQLPKFKLNFKQELSDDFKQMGASLPFQKGLADFTGINSDADLFISKVFHQSFVDVNEEGTEAAAATGVAIEMFCLTFPIEFVCNRPFLFIIHEKINNNVLFIGKYNQPE